MSFILDALKKSENERARQNGPALFEARVLPPRRGVPAWAVAVGLVLLANLALLAWVLLRTAPPGVAPPPQAAPPPAPVSTPAPAPAAAAPPPAAAPSPAPATIGPPQTIAPPPLAPAELAPPPAAAVVNPADYAPARPAGSSPRPPASGSNAAPASLDPALPTASDLTASGAGLPALRMALHVYDEDPANRYVLVNSQRLREGQTTSEGARVEAIAPEGVLMSWRGQRFRLLQGE